MSNTQQTNKDAILDLINNCIIPVMISHWKELYVNLK